MKTTFMIDSEPNKLHVLLPLFSFSILCMPTRQRGLINIKTKELFIGDHFGIRSILPAKFDARCQLKYNVQPDWSNQIITFYLIGQFKQWSDMILFHSSEMISYHSTEHFINQLKLLCLDETYISLQDGWILASFSFLRSYKPRLGLGPKRTWPMN